MKDTALAALKRSAKAVLKDELKAMRAELKQARQSIINAHSTLYEVQARLSQAERSATAYSNELGRVKERTRRAWAFANREFPRGSLPHCLAEWTNTELGGPGFGIVNPFDRWGQTRKP